MEFQRDKIIEWIQSHIGDVVAGCCFFLIGVLLFILKRQFTIGILALISIIAIAVERRAKPFDKIVSVSVIFFLAIGFMLFN